MIAETELDEDALRAAISATGYEVGEIRKEPWKRRDCSAGKEPGYRQMERDGRILLAEFLADRGDWAQVMPGARPACSPWRRGTFPCLSNWPPHFEALFCLRGAVTLTRRDGSSLTAGAPAGADLTDLPI